MLKMLLPNANLSVDVPGARVVDQEVLGEEVRPGPDPGRVAGVGRGEEQVPVAEIGVDAGVAVKAVHREQPAAVQAVVDRRADRTTRHHRARGTRTNRRSLRTASDARSGRPARSVIRNELLTTCMTCSGPTPSHGSGGSPFVSGPLLLERPSKPGCPIAGCVVSRGLHGRREHRCGCRSAARCGVDPAALLVNGSARCGTGPLVRRPVAGPCCRALRDASGGDPWTTSRADARSTAPSCARMRRCGGGVDGPGGHRGKRAGGPPQRSARIEGRRRMASPSVLGTRDGLGWADGSSDAARATIEPDAARVHRAGPAVWRQTRLRNTSSATMSRWIWLVPS